MILRSWITENCKGNITGIRLISHSTGYILLATTPEETSVKNLIIEAITKFEGN